MRLAFKIPEIVREWLYADDLCSLMRRLHPKIVGPFDLRLVLIRLRRLKGKLLTAPSAIPTHRRALLIGFVSIQWFRPRLQWRSRAGPMLSSAGTGRRPTSASSAGREPAGVFRETAPRVF